MKKKLAMRIASLALCVIFTGMLFGVPRAEAMGLEVATGSLAVATYLSATGAPLVVTPGASANLVATGISSMASSYVGATGVASSGSAWLSSLAAGVSISPAGMIVLSAAAVVAIGAFVAWYVGENGLDSEGSSAVILSDSSYALPLADGSTFPLSYMDASGNVTICNKLLLSEFSSTPQVLFVTEDGYTVKHYISTSYAGGKYYEWSFTSSEGKTTYANDAVSTIAGYGATFVSLGVVEGSDWFHNLYFNDVGECVYKWVVFSAVNVSDYSVLLSSDLSVVRDSSFTQPDTEFDPESQKQMLIDAGFPAGTTLDTVAEQVPELIVAGTFAPTYEITTTETGEGDGTETEPEEETGIYIPILSDIKAALSNLGTSIVDGVKGLFVPSEAAINSLSDEVDSKLPFIPTLQGFGDDLVYNLEHPEECADGLGLTTVVDLSKGRGSYLGNTKHELLDVSWYLEYKPLVDDIIVGFFWLCFLWNLYGALPRIIHGEGSTITVNAMDFPTVNEGSLTQKSLGPSDGKIWGEGGKWKMW